MSTSDVVDALLESNMPIRFVRCSLSTPGKERGIEHELVPTSVTTSESHLSSCILSNYF